MELFEDLFHTTLKLQLEMTEMVKINHFQSLLRKDALQTVKIMQNYSRGVSCCISPQIRQTAVSSDSQTQLAQTDVQSI